MEDDSAETTDCDNLEQIVLNGCFYMYPYKIIGDNIDKKVQSSVLVENEYTMLKHP